MKKLLLVLVSLLFSIAALAAVNINTATKEELDAIKGIGPVKAQAIIDYRKAHGPFKSVDDLKEVKGIGDKTLESIRSDLSVSGANTGPSTTKADAKPAKEEKKAEPKAVAKEDKKAVAKPAKEDKKADAKKEGKKDDAKKSKKDEPKKEEPKK